MSIDLEAMDKQRRKLGIPMNKSDKEVFEFEKGFDDKLIFHHMGRLLLASGNLGRLIFTPDGLKMAFRRSSMTNGDVFWLDDFEGSESFGLAGPIKKNGETNTTRHEGDDPSVQSGEGETQENQEDL